MTVRYFVDPDYFTGKEIREIHRILMDKRGWGRAVNFQPVDIPNDDVVIIIKLHNNAISRLFPKLVGLSVTVRRSALAPLIIINAENWDQPPADFGVKDKKIRRDIYRAYVIQHEMGHVLGHGHAPTPTPTHSVHSAHSLKLCPVMYQQTKGTKGICIPNPWHGNENSLSG